MTKENSIHKDGTREKEELLKQQYTSFLSMTTHDLLAPLRKLGVLTDRLTQKFGESGDEDTRQYTDRIHACIEEMRSIVNGCLQVAEAIPENMNIVPVNTAEIAEGIFQEKKLQAKEKGASLSANNLPVIEGDEKQLRILFREIIENAFVFAKKDLPLKFGVSALQVEGDEKEAAESKSGSHWKFTFTDNGIGFKNEDSEKIFDPTVRLHGKSAFPGNGMGLTLVKKIVANHRGCIYAESSPDGSRFTVILPKTH